MQVAKLAKVEARGYRGIDRAEIWIGEGIQLLAGGVGKGKTSLIQLIQANLLCQPNLFGLSKTEAKKLVHRGAKSGYCKIIHDQGERTISYPGFEVSTQGSPLDATEIAVGRVKPARLPDKLRSEILTRYCGAEISRERLAEELADEAKLDKGLIAQICDTVFGTAKLAAKGWEAGEKWAEVEATARKRMFQNATGRKWGSDQGITFIPDGWEPDLADAKLEDLEKAVVKAREDVESAIRENAVSEADLGRLNELAESENSLNEKLADVHYKFVSAADRVKALEKSITRAELNGAPVKCLGCQMIGVVEGGLLLPSEAPHDPEQLKIDRGALKDCVRERDELAGESKFLQQEIKRAQDAKHKLKERASGGARGSDVGRSKEALARAEARLKAFKTKQDGLAYHAQVTALLKAKDICSSEGLRKRVLIANLAPLNEELAELCRVGGFEKVSLSADLQISYGQTPFLLASKGEKWITDAVIQLVLAKREGAHYVVFDDANLLGRPELNGLIKALGHVGIPSVVGLTFSASKDGKIEVPNLAKLGKGTTYWITDGTARKLDEQEALTGRKLA